MRLITIFFLLFCVQFVFAQKTAKKLRGRARIDSLLKELPKQKEDTNKAKILNTISSAYSGISPDTGIAYARQDSVLAAKLSWKKGLADAGNVLGQNIWTKGDYTKALQVYSNALSIYEEIGYKNGIGAISCNIGVIYQFQGDYPKALEYLFKALKIDEEIGNKPFIAIVTGNIGNIYARQGNYSNALDYYFKAVKMYEELGDNDGIASITGNIGTIYGRLGDYAKALEYDFKALKMDEQLGNKRQAANVTGNIGLALQKQGDHPRALEYYFKALKLNEELGNKDVVDITANIGSVYSLQGNHLMAIEYTTKAYNLAEQIGARYGAAWALELLGFAYLSLVTDTVKHNVQANVINEPAQRKYMPVADVPDGKQARLNKAIAYLLRGRDSAQKIGAPDVLRDCYENLSTAYKLTGDFKKAMECADAATKLKDSINLVENSKKIAAIESRQKEIKDSLNKVAADKELAAKDRQRSNYMYIGAGVLVLALVFILFLGRNNSLLSKERRKSDDLLLNILPEEVAGQLKEKGTAAAKQFDNVTVLFSDFVDFTKTSERLSPQALVEELDACFKKFDEIVSMHGIEKIKTIGDAYLACAGLPTANDQHALQATKAAIEINKFMDDRYAKLGDRTFRLRIGLHSGSVVAGIVGNKKFAYDIWGDTVNTAARMEQNCEPGKINISESTYELIKDKASCTYRGEIEAKGKGKMKMYYVS